MAPKPKTPHDQNVIERRFVEPPTREKHGDKKPLNTVPHSQGKQAKQQRRQTITKK